MQQSQKQAAQDQRSVRVALIDDDVELKVVIEDLLKGIEGYEYDLIWINDSERAELLLARSGVDVCLLDHMLGARSAIEVLERLNSKAIDIPVVLLIEAEDAELVREARERGILDHLVVSEITKPLLAVYRRMLPSMSQTEREALEAGSIWWDGELFSGMPDWDKLMSFPAPHSTILCTQSVVSR